MKINDWIIPPLIAVTLLTRLPLYRLLQCVLPQSRVDTVFSSTWSHRHQGLSVLWYPLVGGLLALTLAILLGGIHGLFLDATSVIPRTLDAVFIITLWVILTGALHLDGVADAVDAAFFAHKLPPLSIRLPSNDSNAENLQQQWQARQADISRVFKDPNAGSMAVVALVLLLLLKVSLLAYSQYDIMVSVAVAMVLARVMAMLLLLTTPYISPARQEAALGDAVVKGMGQSAADRLPKNAVALVALLSWLMIFILFPIDYALPLCLSLAGVLWWWRRLWMKAMKGIVGDCIGALIELCELAILLVFCLVSL